MTIVDKRKIHIKFVFYGFFNALYVKYAFCRKNPYLNLFEEMDIEIVVAQDREDERNALLTRSNGLLKNQMARRKKVAEITLRKIKSGFYKILSKQKARTSMNIHN